MKDSFVMFEMVHGYVVSCIDDIHKMFIKACIFFFGRGGGCFGLCVGVCFVTTPPLYYLYIPSIKYL